MSLVPYQETAELEQFSNMLGVSEDANYNDATRNRIATMFKLYKAGKLNDAVKPFSISFTITNTETAEQTFYLHAGMLAGKGDNGVIATGTNFKSLEDVNKLALTGMTGNLNVFQNWLLRKPTMVSSIIVSASTDSGINGGSITQYNIQPNISAGFTQNEPVNFAPYNQSNAFSSKKVEINDRVFFLDDESAVVVKIAASTALTFTLNCLGYNKDEYASVYRKQLGR